MSSAATETTSMRSILLYFCSMWKKYWWGKLDNISSSTVQKQPLLLSSSAIFYTVHTITTTPSFLLLEHLFYNITEMVLIMKAHTSNIVIQILKHLGGSMQIPTCIFFCNCFGFVNSQGRERNTVVQKIL